MKYSRYDIVIIGSGLSGLYLANKLNESNKFNDGILLLTKEELFSGSTALAQGGIVSVIPEINKKDTIESHIKDTLKAGCGINNIATVELVSKYSALIAQELIRFGVKFDKSENNILNFTLEAAHSCPRILHAQGDSTGRVIEKALVKRIQHSDNIDIYTNSMAVELLLDSTKKCRGLISYNYVNNSYEAIYSNCVVIATGGIGQIYKNTTNPTTSTGDGIALAYNSGAEVENMEFVQFHPTGLYTKNKKTFPLVSESARGEGAKLVDKNGEYFTKNYHHLGDLAPRDIVARAIYQQQKKTDSDYVNLDISQIGIEKFKQRFPTITSLCNENNVDINNGLIPVTPVQHYFMGGIKVDTGAKTSIENLYAIGECSSTGLHGANRLASNSLLECGVFAQVLYEDIEKNYNKPPKMYDETIKNKIEKYKDNETITDDDKTLIENLTNSLKETMTKYVGISRNKEKLDKAIEIIEEIESKFKNIATNNSRQYYELSNSICCAKLVTKAALKRTESIGAHFRSDTTVNEIENTKLINERIKKYEQLLAK